MSPTCLRLMRILARVHRWTVSYSQYTLPPQSFLQESTGGKSQLHLKQLKWTIPREFPDYWWLFQMLHVLYYGARLVEERRKKERKKKRKKERRRWTILTFDRFRFATLKLLLHIAITTADWGKLYKPLDVLLDMSISSLAMLSPWKC